MLVKNIVYTALPPPANPSKLIDLVFLRRCFLRLTLTKFYYKKLTPCKKYYA